LRPAQAIHNWQLDQKADLGLSAPKPRYVPAFRTLVGYMKPHAWRLCAVVGCAVASVMSDLLQPYLVKVAIDDNLMAGRNDWRALIAIGGAYFLLSVAGLAFTYLQGNLLQAIGQSVVAKIRTQLFDHILKQSMRYFDRMSRGGLITHISSDTEAISQFFNQVLLSLIRDGFTVVLILAMMFRLDATLALYSLLLLPAVSAVAAAFRSRMRKTYQLARTRLSRMVAFVAENLSGMSIVQAFHQQKEQQKRLEELNEEYFRANLREIGTNVAFGRTFELLSNLFIAFITWAGGRAVVGHSLEFGVLYAFIAYIRQFFQPVSTITQQWNTLQAATVAVTRIWDVLSQKPDITDRATRGSEGAPDEGRTWPAEGGGSSAAGAGLGRFSPERVKGGIVFDRISFSYDGVVPVIRDLDLEIAPGEMIGIVGSTGAGKSSLISLLCRFYDVDEGSIRIDGTDIRDIPQAVLHRLVGLVQQEPFLYSGSLIDNVRLFDESVPREDVIRACELVGADMIAKKMRNGYDARLSGRGSGLSAGERQLIAFARIAVFRPKVLILDEASANLDSHTEQLLQHALDVVSRGRTTIVIAHRLSTVRQADRIIVMSRGRIAEQGTHEQLLSRRGMYWELYRLSVGQKAGLTNIPESGEQP